MHNKNSSLHAAAMSIGLVIAIALTVGCGSGNSNLNSGNILTQAQAQQVATAVSNGLEQALGGAFGAVPVEGRVNVMRKDESLASSTTPTCSVTTSGESCNWPVAGTFACPGGGSMSVSGDVSGSLNALGTGSVQEQIAATPANCSVNGIVLNGAPQVTVAGQLGLSNWNPVWPLTGTEKGGVTFGPNPSGKCQFNVRFSINSDSSCSITGTVCGQPVSGHC